VGYGLHLVAALALVAELVLAAQQAQLAQHPARVHDLPLLLTHHALLGHGSLGCGNAVLDGKQAGARRTASDPSLHAVLGNDLQTAATVLN
jgi:hypothetical protein